MIQRPDLPPPPAPAAEPAPAGAAAMLPHLEAVLFVADEPLGVRRLAELLGEEKEAVEEALQLLGQRYAGNRSGVHLVEIAGGWRMLTNPECAEVVTALKGLRQHDRLSPAALETLAIVAYRQPVSRAEIERIRGVGAGPVLRHLLELDLIQVSGREEGLGRALLYGTTRSFLDRFGLKSVRDLPASLEI